MTCVLNADNCRWTNTRCSIYVLDLCVVTNAGNDPFLTYHSLDHNVVVEERGTGVANNSAHTEYVADSLPVGFASDSGGSSNDNAELPANLLLLVNSPVKHLLDGHCSTQCLRLKACWLTARSSLSTFE